MNKEQLELIVDNHISTNVETPIVKNAFAKSDLVKFYAFYKVEDGKVIKVEE